MDFSSIAHTAFMWVYTFMLVMVSLFGLHRYVLVYLYFKHRKNVPQAGKFEELPTVTIQLPMFNERLVAKRIIAKTCQLDYPREKLQIQVLDDSTDDTVEIASQAVEDAKAQGFDIEYIHRTNREGFKAGALTNGMSSARGEFITIFDADFVPDKDFLNRSIHYFANPKVCVVQTRWDHINRNDSLLTRSQALFLDGHFGIEHVARNRSNRFMAFNGTAGTWRRSAIEDAGGWQHDTLTEDLDLSYRAQLKGWKFVFLPELKSPAELPPEMNAFKAQQFRWTKGGAQTAIKMLPKVMLSKAPLKVKLEAFFHLTCFTVHLYMLMLVLMLFPAMCIQSIPLETGTAWRTIFDISVFTLATMSATVFYMASQVEVMGDWRTALKFMPMLMALGVGMSVSNAKGVLEAFFGKKSEFVRTPKYGSGADQGPCDLNRKKRRNWLPFVEFLMGMYMVGCVVWSITTGMGIFSMPFIMIFAFGFFYVSIMSVLAERRHVKEGLPALEPAGESVKAN